MLKPTEVEHSLWACLEKLETGTKDPRYLYIDALMSLLKPNSDMIE